MKRKFIVIFLGFSLIGLTACNEGSSSDDSSLSKVQEYLRDDFSGISVASSITDDSNLLYLSASEQIDSSGLESVISDLSQEEWFDYDYVLTTLYGQEQPVTSVLLDCSTGHSDSHDWSEYLSTEDYAAKLTVLFEEETSQERIDEIGEELKQLECAEDIKFVSAEEVMERYLERYFKDNPELAAGFKEDNPLANSACYEVTIKTNDPDAVKYEIERIDNVRQVNLDYKN